MRKRSPVTRYASISVAIPHTNVRPGMDDLNRREANNTHDHCDCAERKSRNEAPDLTLIELQLPEKREG
jgi:hypothetical protein